jgi:aryl-alcohol dehydrogenase-like predicted oxidoreductase
MKKKKLGWTELEFTRIGLGTFPMGGPDWEAGWGPQADRESINTIQRAIELGVNWIDTAPAYGLGKAEELVCAALSGSEHKPLIATKCGLVWDESRKIHGDLTGESVRKEAENSLRRLGIETIDLYQIHWPNPDSELEEGWEAIAGLIEEGKVRYGGVSNCSVEQLKRLQKIHPIASLQPPYSMIIRDVEEELLAFCAANDIGVIPYSPMQRGLLTGKYNRERVGQLDPDDHRLREPYFQEPELSVNLDFVEKLRPVAKKNGRNLAQLAIAWILRRPEVTAAIVGARSPSQIERTVPAGDWSLSETDIEEIDGLLADRDRRIRAL